MEQRGKKLLNRNDCMTFIRFALFLLSFFSSLVYLYCVVICCVFCSLSHYLYISLLQIDKVRGNSTQRYRHGGVFVRERARVNFSFFICSSQQILLENRNRGKQNEIAAEKWKQFEHNTEIEAVKGVTTPLISIRLLLVFLSKLVRSVCEFFPYLHSGTARDRDQTDTPIDNKLLHTQPHDDDDTESESSTIAKCLEIVYGTICAVFLQLCSVHTELALSHFFPVSPHHAHTHTPFNRL